MDFELTQTQHDLGGLARQILTDRVTTDRLRAADGTRFDRELWAELARAGVLSAALPEAVDGAGLGLLEQCSVLIEIGRSVAPVPYLPSVVLAAGALAAFGSEAQRQHWAVPAGRGEVVLAVALAEEDSEDPRNPATTAAPVPGGWQLTGAKTAAAAGALAGLLLVSAATPAGPQVFLVRPGDPGVTMTPQVVTGGDATALVELAGAFVPEDQLLGDDARGQDVLDWLASRATLGLCALQLGVTQRALEMTAAYAQTREQFGKPIGSFQAVSQRLADGYIDVEGLRLTLWQAAWRLAEGLSCETELATAKFWAAEAGHRLAHTAVHIHGGVGIDTEGDVHRYYVAAKYNEFALGGATAQLRTIGAALAAD